MLRAVSFDVGNTLALSSGPGLVTQLLQSAQRSPQRAQLDVLTRLHEETTSQDLVDEVCEAIGAPRLALEDYVPPRLLVSDEAVMALQELVDLDFRLVTLANLASVDDVAFPEVLAPFFDAFIKSYEIGFAKPKTEAFDAVCDALGMLPSQIAHVGDSRGADVNGAILVGMHPVLLSPTEVVGYLPHPDSEVSVVKSLLDVRKVLEGIM